MLKCGEALETALKAIVCRKCALQISRETFLSRFFFEKQYAETQFYLLYLASIFEVAIFHILWTDLHRSETLSQHGSRMNEMNADTRHDVTVALSEY